jgi:hypothetical protein
VRGFSVALYVALEVVFGPYHRQQGGPRADGTHHRCKGVGSFCCSAIWKIGERGNDLSHQQTGGGLAIMVPAPNSEVNELKLSHSGSGRCNICRSYPLAQQFLALAEQQNATAPIMIGHHLLAMTLLCMGSIAKGLSHLDRACALYDPAAHRPLAQQFGHDVGAAALAFRPLGLWLLGYPKTALVEADRAIAAARDTDHIPTMLFGLSQTRRKRKAISSALSRSPANNKPNPGNCAPP